MSGTLLVIFHKNGNNGNPCEYVWKITKYDTSNYNILDILNWLQKLCKVEDFLENSEKLQLSQNLTVAKLSKMNLDAFLENM